MVDVGWQIAAAVLAMAFAGGLTVWALWVILGPVDDVVELARRDRERLEREQQDQESSDE